jgi:hypothetical protein
VWGFGRAIALWGFNALRQFRSGSHNDLCGTVVIAELALMARSMQIALPNRTTFQLPAKRVQSKSPMRSAIALLDVVDLEFADVGFAGVLPLTFARLSIGNFTGRGRGMA